MAIAVERFIPFLMKNRSPSKELTQRKGELGWQDQLPTLARSLLLTAAISFGIKLDHDQQQAIAELAKPAFTLSQIEQRRITVDRTRRDKRAWEAVGLGLAFILVLRMEKVSRNPTIDPDNKPPQHALPDFWVRAIATGQNKNNQ